MADEQASIYEAWIQHYLPLVGGNRARAETAAGAARQAFERGQGDDAERAGLRAVGLGTSWSWLRPPIAFWIGLGGFILFNVAWNLLDQVTCAAGDSLANPFVAAFVQTCPSASSVPLTKTTVGPHSTFPWVPFAVNFVAPIALAFTRYRAAAIGILVGLAIAAIVFVAALILLALSGF